MEKIHILWVDDEIDLMKPYLLFLEEKGYEVTTANNGNTSLDLFKSKTFDIVFLDESMPGLSGLETLSRMKAINNGVPVIMITKNEAESIMEDAIGSQIADYLIKPVNPNQILLALKKNLDKKRLVNEKTNTAYQQEFRNIGMTLNEKLDFNQWVEIYKKLVYWEMELGRNKDEGMYEVLTMQKSEANTTFSKFVEANYFSWLKKPETSPLLSPNVFREKVFPLLDSSPDPVFFVLIDNLRYDQWKIIQPMLNEFFKPQEEGLYCAILPTATQYARNSIFAGMMPDAIASRFPNMWKNDEDEGGKNLHEEDFLADQLKRAGKNIKFSYTKITNLAAGKVMSDNILNMMNNKLNVIVYNFVDALSHARTEMEVIRELADDEAAYRSITHSWFEHSPLFDALKKLSGKKIKMVITTDHGTIRVTKPCKIVGDRNTNSNLRYKNGKSLSYDKREVFEVKNPVDAMLPKTHLTTSYAFAREDYYFVYPNNYSYFVNFYKNTFQHGGVSLEEMIIPIITMSGQ